ncbi:hemolysin family protein [Haloquadratum walsbyi]|jgi:Hemolysins and related proteins containing CBS domains|uniref:Hemolysin related proteins containing CBS domain protein n=1 Tax=Haloquadratum walsbyi J07HQW2 TaxID=1238425 RepID=U1MZG1_9EURY|nr:hemolysin family protein [Haloquadratum walsbyi]ERG95884.1 MAG: hemolysin related proteins containing CBS domain protein [Haloquadratum walsbyi J07HQW2]
MGLSPSLSLFIGQLAPIPVTQTTVTVAGGFVIVLLIGFSAFFSSSEIAMFSLAKHRVDALVEDGVPGAGTVDELKSNPHRLLVTILVGNNIVNIAMSSLATALVSLYFDPGAAVLVSTFGITSLVLLFGESAPKSYAVENTESWALRIARPLKYSEYVLLPLVIIFDRLTRIINRITGGRSEIETSYVTRDEIQDLIQTGEREGVIEEDEREMLDRIFQFNQTIVKEVMTPRLDMTAVAKDATVEEAIETCIHSDHERVPVYDGNLDNVIGTVTVRDLVREKHYGEGDIILTDIVQPTLHVPESKNVDELLTEIQDNRLRMVIVIDEFGTTEGLVTLEDMVEEIVGDILEDDEEEAFEFIDTNETLIRGEVNIDEVNDELGLDLPEGEEFETLAGFIFNRVGRLVEEGEQISFDGITICIEQVDNTRIMKARVIDPGPSTAEQHSQSESTSESQPEPEMQTSNDDIVEPESKPESDTDADADATSTQDVEAN